MMRKTPIQQRFSQKARGGFTLLELLLAVGIVAILAVALSFGVSSVSERARAIHCMSNLKTLGAGIQQYAMDHQGRLPMRSKPVYTSVAQQWHREMWPSARPQGAPGDWGAARTAAQNNGYKGWPFHCPADRDPASTTPGLSYAMNTRITDARLSQLKPTQILILELKNRYMASGAITELENDLTKQHGSVNHVLFADLHIEMLPASEIPRRATTPAAWDITSY